MADPNPYSRGFSFTDFQTLTPQDPLPGLQVDVELDTISGAIGTLVGAVTDIRRSDGKLKNGIVTKDALVSDFSIGFTLRGVWASGVQYAIGDGIVYNSKFYKALSSHTASNANRPDLDAVTWQFLTDLLGGVPLDGSVSTPKIVDGAVTLPKLTAGLLPPVSPTLNLTRTTLAAFTVPAVITAFVLAGHTALGDRGRGAPYKLVGAVTATSVTDAGGRIFDIDASGTVDVGWFGAKADAVTNDSAAFNAALAAASVVYAPAGIYNASGITVPASKALIGAEKNATSLRPNNGATRSSFIVKALNGARVADFTANGNNQTDSGVIVDGSYVRLHRVHAQYCTDGFYNTPNGVAVTWTETSTDNNTRGINSVGGFNNSVVIRHYSQGNDTYGFFSTYVGPFSGTLQPQSVQFLGCVFFGNTYGVWFDRNLFDLGMTGCVIDGFTNTGLRVAEDSADVTLNGGNFIAGSGNYAVYIGAGTTHISITGSEFGNANFGIVVDATATKRCQNVLIQGNSVGCAAGAGSAAIVLDSPNGAAVTDNIFAPVGPQLTLIHKSTYTAGVVPTVHAVRNVFLQGGIPITGKIECHDNIGYKTKAKGIATIASGATSVTINHGMNVAPTHITLGLGGGGVAQNVVVWWDGATATQVSFFCAAAAPANLRISWEATSDGLT